MDREPKEGGGSRDVTTGERGMVPENRGQHGVEKQYRAWRKDMVGRESEYYDSLWKSEMTQQEHR